MSASATPAPARPPTPAPARPATASAWLVVLVVTALAAIFILTAAFSGSNTPASIDGTTATTSQRIDG